MVKKAKSKYDTQPGTVRVPRLPSKPEDVREDLPPVDVDPRIHIRSDREAVADEVEVAFHRTSGGDVPLPAHLRRQ